MISVKTYPEAESIANEISKSELKGLSIIQRCMGKNFIVCDNGGNDRKPHDKFIMWIQNFKSPYRVFSISPKSGQHEEGFPTQKLANDRYYELLKDKYRRNIYRKTVFDGW